MNKCNVQFVCNGYCDTCELAKKVDVKDYPYNFCAYEANGYCTNKEAQIKSLIDEGFEICDRSCKQDMGRED